jgi:hypothetical protein
MPQTSGFPKPKPEPYFSLREQLALLILVREQEYLNESDPERLESGVQCALHSADRLIAATIKART